MSRETFYRKSDIPKNDGYRWRFTSGGRWAREDNPMFMPKGDESPGTAHRKQAEDDNYRKYMRRRSDPRSRDYIGG